MLFVFTNYLCGACYCVFDGIGVGDNQCVADEEPAAAMVSGALFLSVISRRTVVADAMFVVIVHISRNIMPISIDCQCVVCLRIYTSPRLVGLIGIIH